MELKEYFEKNPKAALGFSGGVDSAYLLYAAKQYGADIKPYYMKTQFQPQFEYEDAIEFCRHMGIEVTVIEHDILSDSVIASNPDNRCYHCKTAIFTAIKKRAAEDGYSLVIDGTNASDDLSDRPGAKALAELGVESPLRECGLTKEKIRDLSKAAGLFTWDKPSYSCLATRIRGAISAGALEKAELSENALREMGFEDFRVRIRSGEARIQLKEAQFEAAFSKKAEILEKLKPYFTDVLLDLEAR